VKYDGQIILCGSLHPTILKVLGIKVRSIYMYNLDNCFMNICLGRNALEIKVHHH
jgi:hypothetical protein